MDLTVGIAALSARDLQRAAGGESSAAVRARVVAARARQLTRNGVLNARLQGRDLRERSRLTPDACELLNAALTKLSLTARGHDRLLRVARTIADIEGDEDVRDGQLAEALRFRSDQDVLASSGGPSW
jgi:magnesium chelatase family protein